VIRILHVSDVHFGVNDPKGEQALITDALIKAVDRDKLDPDIVIFSGDLAFSGKAAQFKMGEDWLRRLCELAPRAELFIVPGNHDVERTKVPGPHLLHAAGSKEKSYYDWKNGITNTFPPHLQDFFAWLKTASAVLPIRGNWKPPFGFHCTIESLEIPVHVIGLNSSLLSCDEHDEKNLVVDVRTANEGLYEFQKRPGLIVAVSHHPFEWLVDWNKNELEKFLSQGTGADIFLHGHLHAQLGIAKSEITGKGLATLGAGAAYQGSTWPQQFALYAIDSAQRELQTLAYTYSADSGDWIPDNKISGKLLLDLPLPLRPKPSAGAVEILSDERFQAESELVVVREATEKRPAGPDQEAALVERSRMALEIEVEVLRYRDAAREVAEKVANYFRENPLLGEICYAVKHRVKSRARIRDKMQEKNVREAGKIIDICGFRLITFYQSDIPTVVEHLLNVIEQEGHPNSPFTRGCQVEIDINTSRPESDPLSISEAVQSSARRSPLNPKCEVKSRPTGYSSVHMVISAPTKGGDHGLSEMFLELQIRSALEDIWGEIDHRLRYGSERGGMGVSWSQHLNAFKALIDGVSQYVDVIKRQSEENTPKSPNAIKAARTIAKPYNQLERLKGLKPEMFDRVSKAFDLWKQADASRQRGGDPGALRQAADAFAALLLEFKGEPADDPKLADELEYVASTERAYLLIYTGDDFDLAQSAELYEKILSKRPTDATALFRLGAVKERQKQFTESDRLLKDALHVIESGRDDRINNTHWAYDVARLSLARTRWRIFKDSGSREHLNSAIDLARSVVAKTVDSTNALRAINDLLYYAWEERQLAGSEESLRVSDLEFRHLTDSLEKELSVQERGYEYHDTLMSALLTIGKPQAARTAALRVRDMLEQAVILKVPGLDLGKKGTYAWTFALSRYLDRDQQECLACAQDIIATQ
jgi:ppGpp synthetase/RelA/SpoT-type nucleotidyltranferase/calcineurin-like phosphoesterase family protein